MRRIPDPRPLLVPESEVHRKPCLCEETILADPDRRWQGWKVIAAIEATRELMADYIREQPVTLRRAARFMP
jgi:hypothetical protein